MALKQVIDRSVMHEAAESLLDIGVSLPLFTLRLPFGKSRRLALTMRRPTLGAQIRIARKFVELGVTYEELVAMSADEEQAFIATRGETLSELVALCILRGRLTGRYLARPLAWLLRWRVPAPALRAVLDQWVSLLGTQSFWTTIRYLEVTNPLRLSQTEGS